MRVLLCRTVPVKSFTSGKITKYPQKQGIFDGKDSTKEYDKTIPDAFFHLPSPVRDLLRRENVAYTP
jgi:hypothetical protein